MGCAHTDDRPKKEATLLPLFTSVYVNKCIEVIENHALLLLRAWPSEKPSLLNNHALNTVKLNIKANNPLDYSTPGIGV